MKTAALLCGTVIGGRFQIESLAGSGGMGTVYRALDRQRRVPVALKVLNNPAESQLEARRFAREARILSALSHRGIAAFVDSGVTEEHRPYLVMEWLNGEDLSMRLRRGPLSVLECRQLLLQVAAALACAHRAGIVHRGNNHSSSATGKLVKSNCS